MQLTQKKRQRTDLLTVAAVAALFVVMAALLYTGHLTRQVTNMLVPVAVYIVMAVSLNLVVGLLGELSLGHAGFMSVGLFSGCLVAIALHTTALPLGVRLPVSMLAGGLMAAVFGLLVGLPALRLRGDYLAIVTLACGEIIKNIITNLNITGGALGLDTSSIYAGAKDLLPYGAVLVLLTVAVMLNLKRSKYGRAIMAMPSTTGKGKVSKIVPFLDPGSAVTTTRNDVNYVITEYGIAQLRGKTLRQRAEALIEIAHPDFRDALREEYRRRFPRTY